MGKKNEKITEPVETKVDAPVKAEKTMFPVVGSNGQIIRTYTVDIHGEDAEKLAHQFATKVKGEVL